MIDHQVHRHERLDDFWVTAEPLHLGLGVSFSFNPATDAFLVIPAAVQTLLINARCISVERQGVLVQAYVQWVVDDLRTVIERLAGWTFQPPSGARAIRW